MMDSACTESTNHVRVSQDAPTFSEKNSTSVLKPERDPDFQWCNVATSRPDFVCGDKVITQPFMLCRSLLITPLMIVVIICDL